MRRHLFSNSGLAALATAAAGALAAVIMPVAARAEYRITRDHGGYVDEYKSRYTKLRDKGETVVIDGICNSACTMVLGIVPLSRICATPRASLGFHEAYIDKAWTFGFRVTSQSGTTDLLGYYPPPVKDWLKRNGGLTPKMKHMKNGSDLWMAINPCPTEY